MCRRQRRECIAGGGVVDVTSEADALVSLDGDAGRDGSGATR